MKQLSACVGLVKVYGSPTFRSITQNLEKSKVFYR